MSFAHLVCAVNPFAVQQLLVNYTPETNGTWTTKDNKGTDLIIVGLLSLIEFCGRVCLCLDRDPLSVCFDSDCRKFVAKNVKGLNKKNKNQVDLHFC